MPDLYYLILPVISVVLGLAALYLMFRHFELAIFAVPFSTWVPHIFIPNTLEGILQEEAGIGSYIRISLMLAAGITGAVKFIQYLPRHKGRLPIQFFLIAIFVVLAFISITYSIESNITFIRSATFLAFLSFLIGLYAWIREEAHFNKIFNTLYYLVALFTILSVLLVVAMPGRAWWWGGSRFIGIWLHPNLMGMFCLTAYPMLIWKFSKSRLSGKFFNSGLLLLVLLMHVLTGSRTSLAAAAIGVCVWLIMQRKALKAVIIFGVIFLGFFILIQLRPVSFERQTSKNLTDVTGRDDMWKGTIMLIGEKPLTGYGYAVQGYIWNDPRFFREGIRLWSGSARTSLHNGYLSIAVGIGVFGLIIFLAAVLIPFFRIIRKGNYENKDYMSFSFAFVVMLVIENFFGSTFDSTSSIGAAFFWIGWVIAGKLYEMRYAAWQNPEEEEIIEELEENYAA